MNEETILMQAGLSEEQALTYQCLLEKGPQKASSVAKWTGIKRGLTYKVLQELEHTGLVEKKESQGTVATFFPLHPNSLLERIDRKKDELERSKETLVNSLGTLISKYNLINEQPSVTFFEGVRGLQKIYDDVIREGKDILLIQSPKDRNHPETIPMIEQQIKKQVSKNIHVRAITPLVDDTKEFIGRHDKTNLVTRRVVPSELLNEPAQIMIYGYRKVGITSFETTMVSTIIDDPSINKTFRALFEIIWRKTQDEHEAIITRLGIVDQTASPSTPAA